MYFFSIHVVSQTPKATRIEVNTTNPDLTIDRSNRAMEVTMGIVIKVDRRRDKIVDAPTHNCSVLPSIHMDIAWMSTKKKPRITSRRSGISEKKYKSATT